MTEYLKTIALITGIIVPFFNIPLIYRITKRRSSSDVSPIWSVGVLISFIIMQPYAVTSKDIVFASFNTLNIIFFIIINIQIFKYRKKSNSKSEISDGVRTLLTRTESSDRNSKQV